MLHQQTNHLDNFLQSQVRWRCLSDEEHESDGIVIAYEGKFEDKTMYVTRHLMRSTSGIDPYDVLELYTGNKKTIQLNGEFVAQLMSGLEQAEITEQGRACAVKTHFPHSHEQSGVLEKLWVSLKHGMLEFKDAHLIEQVWFAIRGAPLNLDDTDSTGSWRRECPRADDPTRIINRYSINFNDLQIEITQRSQNLGTEVAVPCDDITNLPIVQIEHEVKISNPEGNMLLTESGYIVLGMLNALEARRRSFTEVETLHNFI